jgi:hypothetical protein
MPKSITTWYCNKCDKSFDNEKDATECEHTHFIIEDVDHVIYQKGKQCPEYIVVNVDIGGDIKQVTFQATKEGWASR